MRNIQVNDLVNHNGKIYQVLYIDYNNITIKNINTGNIKVVSQGSLDPL